MVHFFILKYNLLLISCKYVTTDISNNSYITSVVVLSESMHKSIEDGKTLHVSQWDKDGENSTINNVDAAMKMLILVFFETFKKEENVKRYECFDCDTD